MINRRKRSIKYYSIRRKINEKQKGYLRFKQITYLIKKGEKDEEKNFYSCSFIIIIWFM